MFRSSTRVGKATLRLGALTALAALIFACVAGCSSFGYYAQSIGGHMAVMRAAQPVDEITAQPATSPDLKRRLLLAAQARAFATEKLGLPDNDSYKRYADLQRASVVWNVVAVPALSFTPKQWCFPVAGCVTYRGYYSKAEAEAFAAQLRAEGWDVNVGGVPAYSTLGYFADPLLNTFINWPEAEVARLIFHELAHQVAYAKGDTTFNESFAVAVEQEGLRRWLRTQPDALRTAQAEHAARRAAFLQLLQVTRRDLDGVYQSAASDAEKSERKVALFALLKREYGDLKKGWPDPRYPGGLYGGYDGFFAQELNNAHLAAINTYTDKVAAFERLLQRNQQDLPKFYAEVKRLAALSQNERDAALSNPTTQANSAN
jgi:predicted aminopeptidase